MSQFYDGNKLLNLKDLDGNTPELFFCTSNRNAGKTTYFGKYLINNFMKRGKMFGLLYRYDYDLDGAGEKFFSNIQRLFFPDMKMTEKAQGEGKYTALFLDGICCGYALALNNAKYYRQFSQYFSDVETLFFDEFQPEDSADYLRNEITKFRSVHTSLARGNGKQVRYLPVILTGNPYTILNPYYNALGIGERLTAETKFIRGHGWVLEQGFNEAAAQAANASAFNRAFTNHTYFDNIGQGVYLNDKQQFIEKPSGRSRYMCTLKYNSKYFAVRAYDAEGLVYCDKNPDMSAYYKIGVTNDDMSPNYVSVKMNKYLIDVLKKYFNSGCFRFKDQECKKVIFTLLSIAS